MIRVTKQIVPAASPIGSAPPHRDSPRHCQLKLLLRRVAGLRARRYRRRMLGPSFTYRRGPSIGRHQRARCSRAVVEFLHGQHADGDCFGHPSSTGRGRTPCGKPGGRTFAAGRRCYEARNPRRTKGKRGRRGACSSARLPHRQLGSEHDGADRGELDLGDCACLSVKHQSNRLAGRILLAAYRAQNPRFGGTA